MSKNKVSDQRDAIIAFFSSTRGLVFVGVLTVLFAGALIAGPILGWS